MSEGKYSALSALLDFYSDRAVAHASYFVAFAFGLFSILDIARNMGNVEQGLLLIVSWVVWVAGLHCLLNFGFYSYLGERTKDTIRAGDKVAKDLSIMEIDEGIHKDLFLDWRWNIIRDYLFLRLAHRCTEYKDWDREQAVERRIVIGKIAKADAFYFGYWLIFAFASVAVFKTSFVFQIHTICLFGSLLLIVLDSFNIPRWMISRLKTK